jgi:1-acyl-sn-glycerol-3-phosphate acyltransferase
MFWYLRVILFYLAVALATVVFYPILLCYHWFGVSYKLKYNLASLYSYLFILFARLICGLRYKISGLDKIPEGPAVFMANHQSFWDNMIVQMISPIHSWVIKRELLNIPVFGWGLAMLNPIAINRKDNMSVGQILKSGKKKLEEKWGVVFFPEGTRLNPSEHRKYKPAGTKLAIDCRVPIVLIAHNAGMCWPKHIWIKRPGLIEVEVLSVIYPSEFENKDPRELTDQIEEKINAAKNRLAKEFVC